MAEVTTQSYNPWDKVARDKEAAEARAKTANALNMQKAQAIEMRNNAVKEFYASLNPARLRDPGTEQMQLEKLTAPFEAQIQQVDSKLNELSMAEKGLMPDGSPVRPEYFSLIDPATGLMMDQYQLKVGDYTAKTLDPTKLEGYQALKGEALRAGPSKWALMMQEMLGLKKATDIDKAARQSASASAQARGNLAMRGGLSSGARERIATQGMRDLLGARQGISRDYNMQNLQLLTDDEKQRLANLNQFTGIEGDLGKFNVGVENDMSKYNIQKGAEVDKFNIGNSIDEKRAMDAQNLDVYKELQKKWAAQKQADATRASGGGGGGGCCFIFLEARYGNGTMDEVVRKFRDENMTERNVRGYHKLSEVLVPLMRKSALAKFLVRALMTDPMVSYGKYYYGKGKIGFLFKPVTDFWLKTFDYLGLEHKYIRENGETV